MYNSIDINGAKVIDFTPQDNQPKCIVHIATIQRLAKLLPLADLNELKDELIGKIQMKINLMQITEECEEFSAFHRSVNLIREYKPESQPVMV